MEYDEPVDDGLQIQPPQHHHRHKDRKRDRGTGHSRRHVERVERAERRHGGEGERPRHRERDHGVEPVRKERDGRHRSSKRRDGSGGRLLEVKKERRNIEMENERELRQIERRREKESGRHRRRERTSEGRRERGDRDRHRTLPDDQVEMVENEEDEYEVERNKVMAERLNLEVLDIEESGSELEEGEAGGSNEEQENENEIEALADADASDVSSAEIDEENVQGQISSSNSKSQHGRSTSKSSSGSASAKSKSSSSSSSSSSNSESEGENDAEMDEKPNADTNGEEPQAPKRFRAGSPPPSPVEGGLVDPPPPKPDDSPVAIPVIMISEDQLLPPYFPALQGCRRVEEFQLLNRIEEGTYGVVYRAKEKRTDEVVALKRLKMEKEKDGFPITSLREINTLLKAQHENIVTVREIVVGSNTDKIFLVMDYVEHDLKALMETLKAKGQVFLPEEVKCLMMQLLRAVAHMHDNWILHRDLKTSNLLLSHKGILKVGDFGLAREYGSPLKSYTPIVVTLWYRAPELLLGCREYSTPIDVWSVGCIFGELLKMEPMFPGKSEANELNLIFQALGTPNDRIWPGYTKLPLLQKMTFADYPVNKLKTRFGHLTDQGIDLMNKFLTFNPAKRVTAEDALEHPFFKEAPAAIDPSMFPTWPAKSELGHRKAAASPKPPSGGHQFKGLKEDDASGFFLGGGDARRQPLGAGFSLKF